MTSTRGNTETVADNAETAGRELVIERVFDALREDAWRAWTDCEHLSRWWGGKDSTLPVCKVDFRVGGAYQFCMRTTEGKEYWSAGVYKEIFAPERLVFTDSLTDDKGNVVPATHYGMSEDLPLEMLVAVKFTDDRGRTKITLTHAGIPAGEERDGAEQGWNDFFDKLADALKEEL
jgi:uncharacterized protein YndB with AHSA1/START domain